LFEMELLRIDDNMILQQYQEQILSQSSQDSKEIHSQDLLQDDNNQSLCMNDASFEAALVQLHIDGSGSEIYNGTRSCEVEHTERQPPEPHHQQPPPPPDFRYKRFDLPDGASSSSSSSSSRVAVQSDELYDSVVPPASQSSTSINDATHDHKYHDFVLPPPSQSSASSSDATRASQEAGIDMSIIAAQNAVRECATSNIIGANLGAASSRVHDESSLSPTADCTKLKKDNMSKTTKTTIDYDSDSSDDTLRYVVLTNETYDSTTIRPRFNSDSSDEDFLILARKLERQT
jgi:hypothetical protein